MTKSNIGPAGRSFCSTFKMNPQLLEFEEVQGRLFKRSRDRWEERKGGKHEEENSQRQERAATKTKYNDWSNSCVSRRGVLILRSTNLKKQRTSDS